MDERKILSRHRYAFRNQDLYRRFAETAHGPKFRSKARRLLYEQKVNLIIIDHLGLIDADGYMNNRVQEIGYITRNLKALARDLQVPVIAFPS